MTMFLIEAQLRYAILLQRSYCMAYLL